MGIAAIRVVEEGHILADIGEVAVTLGSFIAWLTFFATDGVACRGEVSR